MVELDLDAKRAGLDPPSGPTWHVWNHHPFGHPLGPRNQEEATCQSESIERAKSQLDPNWTDSRLEDRDRLGQTASNTRSAAKEAPRCGLSVCATLRRGNSTPSYTRTDGGVM